MANLELEAHVTTRIELLAALREAVASIQTHPAVLRRVAYWDRQYMKCHGCHCNGRVVKDEFGIPYRDRGLCVCYTAYTEYRKQWIALRALVPAHAVPRMIREVEQLYALAEYEYQAEPDFDYKPAAVEVVRIRRRVEAHEYAIADTVLSACPT